MFLVSLDRTVGHKRHTVSLTLDVSPTHDLSGSAHGKPLVYLDLSKQRHESLPGGYSKEQLTEAVKEGVEGGCLQGTNWDGAVLHFTGGSTPT